MTHTLRPLGSQFIHARITTEVTFCGQAPIVNRTPHIQISRASVTKDATVLLNNLQEQYRGAIYWEVKINWRLHNNQTGELILKAHQSVSAHADSPIAFMH